METRSRSRKKHDSASNSNISLTSTAPTSISTPTFITCYHGHGDQQKKSIITWDQQQQVHVKDASDRQAAAASVYSWLLLTAHALWLPRNYPDSVTPDYVPFQIWDTLQAVSSYLRGLLCTQAVLVGLGVGESTASATSATLTWIIRDGLGMLGGVLFASTYASRFGYEIKKWRLFADVINDVGLTAELLAPLFPDFFIYFVVIGTICRSLCGVAAGASRAALMNHFARTGDVADISAKEGIQETTVTLIGLIAGYYCTSWLDGSRMGTWCIFIGLTIFHVYANYQAMSVLCLSSLNEQRLTVLMTQYITSPSTPLLTPVAMSRVERIVGWSPPTPRVIPGVSLVQLLHQHTWEQLMESAASPCDEPPTPTSTPRYLLTWSPGGSIMISYHSSAAVEDYLQSLFHAHCMRTSFSDTDAHSYVKYVTTHFPHFLHQLQARGWNSQHLAVDMGDWRATW